MWPFIANILDWYRESGFSSVRMTVPAPETLLLFFIMTICLLFRLCKIGLLVSYAFVFRWGWTIRHSIFPEDPAGFQVFSAIYIIFGALVFLFTASGMLLRIFHHKKVE